MLRSALLGLGLLLGATLVTACAADVESSDDDGLSTGTSVPVGSGGAAGAGGASGGSGGSSGPCAIDCTTIQTPDCQQAVCNPQTGQCELEALADETPCDDGKFCTTEDTCQGGVCTGGPPNDCGMPADACQEVICDETTMSCSQQALPNGTSCQPADLCISGATCTGGLCLGGSPKDCFFFPVPNACHVATCNPMNGMCEAVVGNEGLPCIDSNDLCTENKTCAGGVCQGGNPKSCSHLTQDCVLGVCDPTSGQCTTQPLMNNDPCDDFNACTTGELCQNGLCTGGTPVTACMSGDSCCPTGCTPINDLDCAVQTLDIGPYGSTFSASSTRGYWFTAPTNFTIKELRVPTDVGTGPQNIQVVKFLGGPPPTYSASTTNHTTLFYVNQVSGTNFIPVNVPVLQGEIIGILGARGTGTLANSYGTNYTYNTTILGQPVTLTRLLYQSSIATAPAGALSQELAGSYSRVEMIYSP